MERPKTTKQYIIELCGSDHSLINSFHNSLIEVPMNDFISQLNLDEIASISSFSWKSRATDIDWFRENQLNKDNAYKVIAQLHRIGEKELYDHKKISDRLETLDKKLNPYTYRNFTKRLDNVSKSAVEKFTNALHQEVKKHVFEGQYDRVKKEQNNLNYGIEIIHSKNKYPKKGHVVPEFAQIISKIINGYVDGEKSKPKQTYFNLNP